MGQEPRLHREVSASREVATGQGDSQRKGISSKEKKWVNMEQETLGVTEVVGGLGHRGA